MLVLGSQCSLSVKGQSSCWAPGEKRDGCGSMQVSGTMFLWSGVEGKSRSQKGVFISPRCLNPCLGLGWDDKTPLLALGLWIYGNPSLDLVFIITFGINKEQVSDLHISLKQTFFNHLAFIWYSVSAVCWLSLNSSSQQQRHAAISRFLLLLKADIRKRVLWGAQSLPYHVWPEKEIAPNTEALIIV